MSVWAATGYPLPAPCLVWHLLQKSARHTCPKRAVSWLGPLAAVASSQMDTRGHAGANTLDDCPGCMHAWMQASAAASGHAATLSLSGGEALLMLSCFFFSLCTVRMGLYAPRMPIVELAAGKKIGLSVASIGWMAASNFSEWRVHACRRAGVKACAPCGQGCAAPAPALQ